VARLNRIGLNRLARHVVPWLPGFGLLHHRGRRSGLAYSTPICVFRRGRGLVVALTYGSESDWVRNVLAAGQCDIDMQGQRLHAAEPRLLGDEAARWLPAPVRFFLRVLHVNEYLELSC
jgi:deazaflavin-dependent oxidoreductase (nitroreductase family)